MYVHKERPEKNKSRAAAYSVAQMQGRVNCPGLVGNRSKSKTRRPPQTMTGNLQTDYTRNALSNYSAVELSGDTPIQMVRMYLTEISPDVCKLETEIIRTKKITMEKAIAFLKRARALKEEIDGNPNITIAFFRLSQRDIKFLNEAIKKLTPIASAGKKKKLSPTARAFRDSFRKKYNKDNPAPKLNLKDSTLTGANYDPSTRKINISKGLTPEEFWDNVLFESYNSDNHDKLMKAKKLKSSRTASPMEHGTAKAKVEFSTMKSYIRKLYDLKKKDIELPSKATRALKDYKTHHKNYEKHFMNSPHDKKAPKGDKASLSTPVLYAYEAVENFEGKHVKMKILEVLKKHKITLSSDKVIKLKNELDSMWPENQVLRPSAYQKMLLTSAKHFPVGNSDFLKLRLPKPARDLARLVAKNFEILKRKKTRKQKSGR